MRLGLLNGFAEVTCGWTFSHYLQYLKYDGVVGVLREENLLCVRYLTVITTELVIPFGSTSRHVSGVFMVHSGARTEQRM